MASVGTAIYNRLNATAGVTAIISDRTYPLVLPQGTKLPACTYQQISGPRIHAMGSDPGLTSPRYQVNAWSTSYEQALSLANQLRLSLQDYSGSTGGFEIQRIFFDNEMEISSVDKNEIVYHIAQDYIIWYST